MKALVLAAGFGTRLRPWTLTHPKALVPVGGCPMLEKVIMKLCEYGVDEVIVNVHHFSEQIIDFLETRNLDVKVVVSDESDRILDTGGALLKVLEENDITTPLLIHNVDILSNADLAGLLRTHIEKGNDVTLLTSGRESSRKLLFDKDGFLAGWHNLQNDKYIPVMLKVEDERQGLCEEAFSGIYIVSPGIIDSLKSYSMSVGDNKFPIMDYFLSFPPDIKIGRNYSPDLELIDIGKPETLAIAESHEKTSLKPDPQQADFFESEP